MGSEEVASRALDEGATNYLRKRGGTERYELLANRIQNAVEQYRTSERVEHLARIRTLVNDVNQALVRAENRDEIETATCEILSDSEPYEAAWLGDVADDRIVPREGAGVPDDALDAVSVSAESADLGPAGDAVRDRDVTVLAVESDRSTAVPPDVDCQSMATVPLVYDTTMFGVLVVYVGETDAFDEAERSLLVELGDDIAHALDSVRTRAELERRNDLFRKAQDIADVGAWEYDVETDELRWTVEVYEIHDLPRDTDVTLEEAIDFYHPEDRTAIREVFQGAIEQGDSYDMELRLTTAGDDYRWVHTRGEPQFEDGELVRIRGTIQDITERKERERELELYRTMVETVPDAVYALDEDLHYIAVNSAMAELTGYSRSELVGSHLSLVVDEDPVETARENRRKLLESDADVLTHEYAHRTADGEEIPGREPVSPASQRRRVPRDCRGDT
ncbi:MAG: PAS domain S-box protein [Salinirussus sp.]